MFGRFSSGPLINEINEISAGPISEEPVISVDTARVACANYLAIVHDFPQVFGPEALRRKPLLGCEDCARSKRLCPQAINAWLIRNAAFVSEGQAQPNHVNSPIQLGSVVKKAYRPSFYGRAVVVPVDEAAGEGEAGFLDLKGVGVAPGKVPSHHTHSSGLEYLGQAISDFFYGWLVDTIFARTCPGYHVLPVYAVLDLGFDIVGGWHGTGPAGLHVRRAHGRPYPADRLPRSGSEEERLEWHIELLLRAFGLSTTGSGTAFGFPDDGSDQLTRFSKPVPASSDLEREKAARVVEIIRGSGGLCLETINVQLAKGGAWNDKTLQFYDLGQVRACRDFMNPVAGLILNGALNVGRILSPADPDFVQPHREFAVDAELCNRRSVNAHGFHAARSLRSSTKRFTQRDLETLLRIGRLRGMGRSVEWAMHKTRAKGSQEVEAVRPASRCCTSANPGIGLS